MPRPQGEVRQALADAAARLLAERGLVVDGTAVDGVTWRDMAAEACVGWEVARRTVCNMARSGELSRIGAVKAGGAERWMSVYAPSALVGLDCAARGAFAGAAFDSIGRVFATRAFCNEGAGD